MPRGKRRESNTSKVEKSVGRQPESDNRKDEKAVSRKPRESLKRKRSPAVGETKNLVKSGGRQRYPPLGPGGVAWVYPRTNVAVKTGDKAHFKIKGTAGSEIRVGEIVLRVLINDIPQVKVCWFYRPEQTPEGRQKHHSEAELMASFHHDLVNLDSLVDKVNVYDSVDEYDHGVCRRGAHDYFYRFFYNHVTRKSVPMDNQQMDLHCLCQSIYNPDLLMIQCNTCQRWYHTSCVSIPRSKARTVPSYICPSCSSSCASS